MEGISCANSEPLPHLDIGKDCHWCLLLMNKQHLCNRLWMSYNLLGKSCSVQRKSQVLHQCRLRLLTPVFFEKENLILSQQEVYKYKMTKCKF